ncbi:glycosyltransferase family 4 protein [Nostoc sp. UHCC 0870]|uniref:glycosyltransferase family 4 protein n=1 Tax=Nostoc sp. UHCC 0870 TaxID=2914041 RepID=UPI001EDF2EBD|nr:glycosyltransferase [Nostoc sp. UHCC 0870]UKO98439.1 glycosyltransferase [Nostoc sp. UHCC 0870]
MRLLLFNLATDIDHPILGFTSKWISALAERVEHIDVITMQAGRIEIPDSVNVYSLGKEKGYSEPRRLVEFYRHLFHILRKGKIDGCFSHMNPLFTNLAAPILKIKGIPIVTWYAHPSLTSTLKLAHHLSDRMVASVATAYPYKLDKLVVIGQGIDTNLFCTNQQNIDNKTPLILCAGRISPVKNHLTLLKATALLRQRWNRQFKVLILGSIPNREGELYFQSLKAITEQLGIGDIVDFKLGVPMLELPQWYQRCVVHINLTPTGFGDKVAWEAMSCGKPCLVANEGFKETLGQYQEELLFRYEDVEDLVKKLMNILTLPTQEQENIGYYLRKQVISRHSLDNLSQNILSLIKQLIACKVN